MNALKDSPELNQMEAQLREMAAQADAGQQELSVNVPDTNGNHVPSSEQSEASQKGSRETENKTSVTETDKSVTEAEKQEETNQENPDPKKVDLSKYSRAKENKVVRQNLSEWQNKLNERERMLAEREEQMNRSAKSPKPQAPSKWSAEELEQAAKDFETEGKHDLAKLAKDEATRIRTIDQQQQAEVSQQEFQKTYWRNADVVVEKYPELKDATVGLGKEVKSILDGSAHYEIPEIGKEISRLVNSSPRGFEMAHQLAKLRHAAASVTDLQKRNTELTQENERLTKLTSLNGSTPTSRPAPKKFDDMTCAEQEAELREAAAELDRKVY